MGRNAVTMAWTLALAGRMARLDADCVQVPTRWRAFNLVTAGFVKAAHRAGLPIHVWTVNDEATMRRLLDLGVDGIMTDRPRTLRSVLVARGQWPGPAPES
jgi:glycerophosphoryl diester phosphodiesterase